MGRNMEYSAGSVSKLFWYIETKETVRLLKDKSIDEVKDIVVSDNLYQQKSEDRLNREFSVISKRLMSLPESLRHMIEDSDIATSKLIVIISIMATDRLFFELMYEVFREKIRMEDDTLKDSDLNVFFRSKQEQSDVCAKWTDSAIKKLKQTFQKYMLEAQLLKNSEFSKSEKIVIKPYIEQELRQELIANDMEKYLYALTGR
ncbi:MAG: DUF1819 family protein [Lachnospiraceae bacterium]|nr:DUF1819 family protein [Lachnospiraceae bacterium]